MLAALTSTPLVSNHAFDVNGNKPKYSVKTAPNFPRISGSLDTSHVFDKSSLDIINPVGNTRRDSPLFTNSENNQENLSTAKFDRNVVGDNCAALASESELRPLSVMSEPVPSTSKDDPANENHDDVHDDVHESHARQARAAFNVPRKSLPLIPRMNQYERHPLLQMKYGETGLSEFDMFVMDRESCALRRGSSITSRGQGCSDADYDERGSRTGLFGDRKLVPRSAHSEVHPLFSRSDSGMCELEQYLIEKNNEVASTSGLEAASTNGKPSNAAGSSGGRRPGERVLERRSTIGKLEPRTSQCERHALLEVRDEFGMSEMEKALQEKHEERLEKGKCCTDCTCKNSRCPKCKILNVAVVSGDASLSSASQADDTSRLLTSPTSADPENVELTYKPSGGGSSKRVRFQHEKNETDNAEAISPRGGASASDNAPQVPLETVDCQILGKGSTPERTCSKLANVSKKAADNSDPVAAVRLTLAGEKNKKQLSDNKGLSDANDRRTAIPKKSCCVS